MLLTLHRAECCLYRGEELVVAWTRTRFDPSPFAESFSAGYTRLRYASKPVAITAPVGSKLVPCGCRPGRRRLATHFDPAGLDAEAAWFLATHASRGFGMGEKA